MTDKEPKAVPATVRKAFWETVITEHTVRQQRLRFPSGIGT
jgi:hypothetical protein